MTSKHTETINKEKYCGFQNNPSCWAGTRSNRRKKNNKKSRFSGAAKCSENLLLIFADTKLRKRLSICFTRMGVYCFYWCARRLHMSPWKSTDMFCPPPSDIDLSWRLIVKLSPFFVLDPGKRRMIKKRSVYRGRYKSRDAFTFGNEKHWETKPVSAHLNPGREK